MTREAMQRALDARVDALMELVSILIETETGSRERNYGYKTLTTALRAALAQPDDAAWHAEADRLKKCVDYATSGIEQEHFRRLLSQHLHAAMAP